MKIAESKVVVFFKTEIKKEDDKPGLIRVGVSIVFDNGIVVSVRNADGKTVKHRGKGTQWFYSYIHRTFSRTTPATVEYHRSGSVITDQHCKPIWHDGKKFKGIPEDEMAERFSPEFLAILKSAITDAEIRYEEEQAARRAA